MRRLAIPMQGGCTNKLGQRGRHACSLRIMSARQDVLATRGLSPEGRHCGSRTLRCKIQKCLVLALLPGAVVHLADRRCDSLCAGMHALLHSIRVRQVDDLCFAALQIAAHLFADNVNDTIACARRGSCRSTRSFRTSSFCGLGVQHVGDEDFFLAERFARGARVEARAAQFQRV